MQKHTQKYYSSAVEALLARYGQVLAVCFTPQVPTDSGRRTACKRTAKIDGILKCRSTTELKEL